MTSKQPPVEALGFRRDIIGTDRTARARGMTGCPEEFTLSTVAAKATLYWVSPQMSELVATCAPTLPSYRVRREDIPADCGLIVFASPGIWFDDASMRIDEESNKLVPCEPVRNRLRGAAWRVISGRGINSGEELLQINLISDFRPGKYPAWWTVGLMYDVAYGFSVINMSDADGRGWDDFAGDDDIKFTTAATLTTMLLMQQPGVATSAQADNSRQVKAALKRRRLDPDVVRVITLRRPSGGVSHIPSNRRYHHRWMVNGHWRNQWYPSRNGHKPIWVDPYLKGPEDAPLLTGEKVYAWVR